MSLPTPDWFDPTPYDFEIEEEKESAALAGKLGDELESLEGVEEPQDVLVREPAPGRDVASQ